MVGVVLEKIAGGYGDIGGGHNKTGACKRRIAKGTACVGGPLVKDIDFSLRSCGSGGGYGYVCPLSIAPAAAGRSADRRSGDGQRVERIGIFAPDGIERFGRTGAGQRDGVPRVVLRTGSGGGIRPAQEGVAVTCGDCGADLEGITGSGAAGALCGRGAGAAIGVIAEGIGPADAGLFEIIDHRTARHAQKKASTGLTFAGRVAGYIDIIDCPAVVEFKVFADLWNAERFVVPGLPFPYAEINCNLAAINRSVFNGCFRRAVEGDSAAVTSRRNLRSRAEGGDDGQHQSQRERE